MRRERRAANVQKMKRGCPNIEVHIDEIVLHGFSAADRYVIGDAFTYELSQLFENNEIGISLINNTRAPTLNARQIIIPSNARPTLIGAQVAKVVHGSLNASNPRGRK